MQRTLFLKRCLVYTLLISITLSTLYYIYFNTTISTDPALRSTWTCTGEGRHQICQVNHFCIDRRHGPFVVSSDPFPAINLINTGETEDIWFKAQHYPSLPASLQPPRFINSTLFVYGLYSPYHFSHALYNGLMPLYSTMLEHGATDDSWTLRATTYDNAHPDRALPMLLPNHRGRELVMEAKDMQDRDRQQLPPTLSTLCFDRAVVGTGNRCSLWYCEGQIHQSHYEAYKRFIEQQPITNNSCEAAVVNYNSSNKVTIGLLNRRHTRHITNLPELIQALTPKYAVRTIDFDVEGCDLVHTAHVVRDLDVLVAPFGNGLGAGLFMRPQTTALVSISARFYSESWFKYPMMAIGRRIYDFACDEASCEEFDDRLARALIDRGWSEQELQEFFMLRPDELDRSPLFAGLDAEERWRRYLQYHKDVARRIDVPRFVRYLEDVVLANTPSLNTSFVDQCRRPNGCCDLECQGALDRNVFGNQNAWM
ncbi:MAG: hypothetical protein EXX96DRAFT_562977 [Benjaminiella poitrasii]|nr:MAG: hypothetical protein EXX96DRAFT_562977 [Benjaminiella poitrasii]